MTSSNALRPPLAGIPVDVRCARDYETLAAHFLAPPLLAYIGGGSGQDTTVAANGGAFEGWSVFPRLLRDVTDGHTRVSLGDRVWSHPIALAPVAFQRLAHAEAETATALAAEATGTTMVCSTLSSIDLETISQSSAAPKWFQLYLQPDREASLDLLRRAEAAGYGAIVLTLDAAIQAPSLRALRAGFQMPPDCVAANLQRYAAAEAAPVASGASRIFQGAMRHAPTWKDLDWLLQQTSLPVWVKGALHPADATASKDRGAAGVVVSNHGGRGLDGAPASLSALPAVREAVGEGYPLIFDSGIRSGTDVFKAIALGADAVMIGRLQMHALAVAGALGVAHMLKLLREELELCMALAGCATLADIDSGSLLATR